MMATAKPKDPGQSTLKPQHGMHKKRGVTFGIQSSQSLKQQKVSEKQKIIENALPINFFHSPGQYNKILIQRGCKQKISIMEKQIGILRSLQYINEPLFEKEKEKTYERVKAYKDKVKNECSIQSEPIQCICCCCDDFCSQCARTCEKQKSTQQHVPQQQSIKSSEWLIDIQAMKRGEQRKAKKKVISSEQDKSCHSRPIQSKYRIEQLINSTLIKTIQDKRHKELTRLIQQQHKKAVDYFNESVRMHNKSTSLSKPKKVISVQPTKAQIRQAYWQSIKDVIAYELRKQGNKSKLEPEASKVQCHKSNSKRNLSPEQISKLRVDRGKHAQRELKKRSQQKAEMSKTRMKKLLALDAKQAQILKKCRRHKFKPSESMIEAAFTNLE